MALYIAAGAKREIFHGPAKCAIYPPPGPPPVLIKCKIYQLISTFDIDVSYHSKPKFMDIKSQGSPITTRVRGSSPPPLHATPRLKWSRPGPWSRYCVYAIVPHILFKYLIWEYIPTSFYVNVPVGISILFSPNVTRGLAKEMIPEIGDLALFFSIPYPTYDKSIMVFMNSKRNISYNIYNRRLILRSVTVFKFKVISYE